RRSPRRGRRRPGGSGRRAGNGHAARRPRRFRAFRPEPARPVAAGGSRGPAPRASAGGNRPIAGAGTVTGGRFEELLERTIGLSAGSIGAAAIRRADDVRLKVCALDSDDAYWGLLRQSSDELQELIENVVVPETWFFRDPHAFAALGRM